MLSEALVFRASVLNSTVYPCPEVICLNRSAAGLEHELVIKRTPAGYRRSLHLRNHKILTVLLPLQQHALP